MQTILALAFESLTTNKAKLAPTWQAMCVALLLTALPAVALPLTTNDGRAESLPYRRTISHASAEAQRLFDDGMMLLFDFNHAAALHAFSAAAARAPQSVMPRWGIAAACGPHVNSVEVTPACHAAARAALAVAEQHLPQATPAERALVLAARHRFASPAIQDRDTQDADYARAMQTAFAEHPEDADIAAYTAEAQMIVRRNALWDGSGRALPGTEETISMLNRALTLSPNHPLALHLLIHALEGSAEPKRAQAASDALRGLPPRLSHLVHMATHIDVRLGRWRDAVETNGRAIAADDARAPAVPPESFYRVYMSHNRHMLAYAALMRGQSALAIEAADSLVARIPAVWRTERPALVDSMLTVPFEVRMRFGRWREILEAADIPQPFPVARALQQGARAVALAALQRPTDARATQDAFLEARANIDQAAAMGTNRALDVLAVMARLVEGEILIAEGKLAEGIDALKAAVHAEDQLRYDEPPAWVQPTRHALGAALLRARDGASAEAVFREDLKRHPDNGWALWGLARALSLQGKTDGPDGARAVQRRFAAGWVDADTPLSSSCMCLPGV